MITDSGVLVRPSPLNSRNCGTASAEAGMAIAPNSITTYFTPNLYAFNLSFAGSQFNYAAAIAIVSGVITMVVAYLVQLAGEKNEAKA